MVETVKSALSEAGASVDLIAKSFDPLDDGTDQTMIADKTFITSGSIMYDAVFVPGGAESVATLKMQGDAIHFINEAFKHCKPIAALGEGVELLQWADLDNIHLAGDDNEQIADRGVVTANKTADLSSFVRDFIQAIAQHRHWDRHMKDLVPA
jgi:catalase